MKTGNWDSGGGQPGRSPGGCCARQLDDVHRLGAHRHRRHDRAQDHRRRRAAGKAGHRQGDPVQRRLCALGSGRTPKAKLKGDFRVKGNGEFRAVGGAETNDPLTDGQLNVVGDATKRKVTGDDEVHVRQGRLRLQRRRLQGDEIAAELDLEAIEAKLRERLAEIDAEIEELTKPPEDASGISFGKRIGEGTSQAIDRFAEVGVAQELEPLKKRIERALEKIEEGSYGTCDNCGKADRRGPAQRRARERALHRLRPATPARAPSGRRLWPTRPCGRPSRRRPGCGGRRGGGPGRRAPLSSSSPQWAHSVWESVPSGSVNSPGSQRAPRMPHGTTCSRRQKTALLSPAGS